MNDSNTYRTSAMDIAGKLFVVATPIGNLADMVPRAVQVLQTVDFIAAEDTRHSARLLEHFNISTPMLTYHDHSYENQLETILNRLSVGESAALISDAGTPLISDPGFRLVSQARQAGITVIPIPGACAFVTALSAAGLPSDRCSFEGFLPAKQNQRRKLLAELKDEVRTLAFYEAPHRILATLEDLVEIFGEERPIVVARELTKTFETFLWGSTAEVAQQIRSDTNQQRGEFVLLVQGAPKKESHLGKDTEHLMSVLLEELPLKQAVSIGSKVSGIKKNTLYQWALDHKDDSS